jgi:hypothetical protein
MIPTFIDQAEQMIYRALDLLSTIVQQSGSMVVSTREFTLPTTAGRFVVLQSVNVVNGTTLTPLVKISREVMDCLYPTSTAVGAAVPTKWAPLTDQVILLGPSPGVTLALQCIGTIRPEALSEANSNTFLSDYLPDLFLAAAMNNITGYQQNFGAQADNPKMALAWQQIYDNLRPGAQTEET